MRPAQATTAALHSEVAEPVAAIPLVRRRSRTSLRVNAWLPRHDIDYGEWEAQGRWLGSIGRCSQWWIGDWVRFGSAKYGERYLLAAQLTGYDEHSLRNIAYVASRFCEVSRRRERLSFSHHAELAALPQDEQERWLDRAQRERLSVAALRGELRAWRELERGQDAAAQAQAQEPQQPSQASGALCCPNCGQRIELPAQEVT